MDNPKYLDLMSKYLSGNIDRTEREELMSWVESSSANQAFFEEMIQLWGMTGDLEEEEYEVDTLEAWAKLEPRLDPPAASPSISPGKIIPFYYRKSSWSIAASLALLVVFAWLLYPAIKGPQMMLVTTLGQEQKEVLLPDGSKVWLNGNSSLEYDPVFEERMVKLEGEAYFDVASISDRTFSISSGNVTTKVLGTVFNVRAYPEEASVEVTVEEGLVEVSLVPEKPENRSSLAPQSVRLQPGKSAMVDKTAQKVAVSEEDITIVTAWQKKKLIFDDEPMPNVAKTLERYFGISIEIDPVKYKDCPVTFEKDNPELEDVFALLEALFDYRIDKGDEKIYSIAGGVCD